MSEEASEEAMISAVQTIKLDRPDFTAKQIHAALVNDAPWADVTFPQVKRACSKAAKRAPLTSHTPAPAGHGVAKEVAVSDATRIVIKSAQKSAEISKSLELGEPADRCQLESRAVPELHIGRSGPELKAAALQTATSSSATAKRFRQAYELTDVGTHQIEDFDFSRDSDDDVPMSPLVENESVLRSCASLIRAMALTDFRAGIPTEVIVKVPVPSIWSHVTQLVPLGTDETNLLGVGDREFVILLACAIRLQLMGGQGRVVLNLVHELRAHAERGCLDSLASSSPFVEDAASLRFTLASLGVKVARRLYRDREARKREMPFDHLSSARLLGIIEGLASDQCQFIPASGVGHWNHGWVAQQTVKICRTDGLAAAADCLQYVAPLEPPQLRAW